MTDVEEQELDTVAEGSNEEALRPQEDALREEVSGWMDELEEKIESLERLRMGDCMTRLEK